MSKAYKYVRFLDRISSYVCQNLQFKCYTIKLIKKLRVLSSPSHWRNVFIKLNKTYINLTSGPLHTWKFPVVLLAEIFFIVFALAGFSGGQRALDQREFVQSRSGQIAQIPPSAGDFWGR